MLKDREKISIVIVDDHPLVIEGFRNVVDGDPNLYLKGQFTSAEAFERFTKNEDVDIVLLDISLPDGSGIQICKELKKRRPDTLVLAISNLSERSIIRQMLHSGANGYLLKTADAKDILDCIWRACDGEVVFSKEVTSIIGLEELNTTPELPELTKRERQILQLLAAGKKSAQIAEELFISPLTVKTHRATLLHKFGTGSIVIAINKAREYRLLS